MTRKERILLFLDYWSLNEPLTQATVLPTLSMVLGDGLADRIVLVTVERSSAPPGHGAPLPPGVTHVPLQAHRLRPRPLARAMDLLTMVPRVAGIARRERAGFIMARGVVAGGIAHFVHKRTGLAYAVDYVEPHADYMADVGEWRRGGPLYRGLDRLIKLQLRTTKYGITVTRNYRERLIAAGSDGDRLLVAPCPVDAERMRFRMEDRVGTRAALGWGDAVIGVYAGKFGGLYHREGAFRAFAGAQQAIGGGFGMVILTPEDPVTVIRGVRAAGFSGDRLLVRYAAHDEVPRYLSGSDLAFAPYRGTPSSACISPMKIGEYWANGLPVLLTRGVGDDSAIVEADGSAGALFDPEGDDLAPALARIMRAIGEPGQRERTASLAERYRSMDLTRQAYRTVLAPGIWEATII